MDEKKIKDGRTRVMVDPVKIKMIYSTFPEYKKDRDITRVVDDILSDYLDKHPLIRMGCERERTFIDSLNKKNKEKEEIDFSTENEEWIKEQKNLPTQKNILFEQFWRTYRSAPKGVSSASKVKAQEQWNKAVKKTGSGQKVIEAAQKAVQDQRIQMEVNGDCLCLPDAFRWLRDEMYEALLEAPIIGAQEQQNSDKPLIL